MKWKTLRHHGVAFPPEHDYRGLVIKIKGEPVKLEPLQEEMLVAWAKKKDTPYVLDPIVHKKFQDNFLADLKTVLPARFQDIRLTDIDWTVLYALADRDKTANLSPEEKKARSVERKAARDELKNRYGTAVIDDVDTEIGAYLVEPPGILMGRGEHPLRGHWKRRILPENVILNLDEDAPVPLPPDGHQWGEIVHKHDALWVASWYDELSKKQKYVWLADSSNLRQERDKEKYFKAGKLESAVERVRAEIRKKMAHTEAAALRAVEHQKKDLLHKVKENETALLKGGDLTAEERKKREDELDGSRGKLEQLEKRRARILAAEKQTRQIATACYLIDRLAMRVGDEKDEEEEALTVGASTLRVEHVKVGEDKIEFDFLGKDSVQWQKFLPAQEGERILARNLLEFMESKRPDEQIFDKIDSTHVNHFLSGIVPGLTAKVFRTYHATTTVRNALKEKRAVTADSPAFEKEYAAKWANLQAAITCNHKRTPPKNWEQSLQNKEEAVKVLSTARPDLAKLQEQIPVREAALHKVLAEQRKFATTGPAAVQAKEAALSKLQALPAPADEKEQAKLDKQRAAARQALDRAQADFERKTARLEERAGKARDALDKARGAPAQAVKDYEERLEKARQQLELAKQTRDYNLGTSLKNYIDPRVYKAWGDYVGFEWKRLYTKALQRKFAWVNQSRARWNPSGDLDTHEENRLGDEDTDDGENEDRGE